MRFLHGIYVLSLFFSIGDVFGQSCESQPNSPFSFQDVKDLLNSYACQSCHNGTTHEWQYDKYELLFKETSCDDPILTIKDASKSLLYNKIHGTHSDCGDIMPPQGDRMSTIDINNIEKWINFGAPQYCVLYFDDIKKILDQNKCNQCHFQDNTEGLWSYELYSLIFENSQNTSCNSPIISIHDAKSSLLYQKMNDNSSCGHGGEISNNPISKEHIARVRDWINVGAPVSQSLLPVNISYFNASLKDNIVIEWSTESEVNTSHFDIEISMNGTSFSTLLSVDANGSADGSFFYKQHFEPKEGGVHYFRIKAVDHDGNIEYSVIRQVIVSLDGVQLSVFPNILNNSDLLKVFWKSNSNQPFINCSIVDAFGNIHFETILEHGENHVDLPTLAAGLYYVQVVEYSESLHYKRIFILQ